MSNVLMPKCVFIENQMRFYLGGKLLLPIFAKDRIKLRNFFVILRRRTWQINSIPKKVKLLFTDLEHRFSICDAIKNALFYEYHHCAWLQ